MFFRPEHRRKIQSTLHPKGRREFRADPNGFTLLIRSLLLRVRGIVRFFFGQNPASTKSPSSQSLLRMDRPRKTTTVIPTQKGGTQLLNKNARNPRAIEPRTRRNNFTPSLTNIPPCFMAYATPEEAFRNTLRWSSSSQKRQPPAVQYLHLCLLVFPMKM